MAEKTNTKGLDVKSKLELLTDEETGNVFAGRSSSSFKKYQYDATSFLGKVAESQLKDTPVYLDTLSPHVMFICGARGSGKSFSLACIAEDLATNNSNVGIVIVDPIGIFWSMKYPNKDPKEISMLADWGLVPKGIDNVHVFIPEGAKEIAPKQTYDDIFTVAPSLLTVDDWCITFGLERFSPTGMLLEKAINKLKKGYKTIEGKKVEKKSEYSIKDIIECMENEEEINSAEKGFKKDSIRAISSRFDAAQSWGVFSKEGTPLAKLSRSGQVSVLDISFLDETVSSLIIGLLARRILAARKVSTRKEAFNRLEAVDMQDLMETEIPPTWLLIDEAHTLIPGGNQKTPASNALIEYVKQGRRPGCSLVFATQQPSAIDTQVLSQVDILLAHKLIFNDDIHAVMKRIPTIVPKEFLNGAVLKKLPIGVGIIGDRREESSRAFLVRVRPRISQHEGRETQTLELTDNVGDEDILNLILKLVTSQLASKDSVPISKVKDLLDTLNSRYKLTVLLTSALEFLEEKGFEVTEEYVRHPQTEDTIDELAIVNKEKRQDISDYVLGNDDEGEVDDEFTVIVPEISKEKARQIAKRKLKKKLFGLIGDEETLQSIKTKYAPILEIKYKYFTKGKRFKEKLAYADLSSGELVFYSKGTGLSYSHGFSKLTGLDNSAIEILDFIKETNETTVDTIKEKFGLGDAVVRARLHDLLGKDLIKADKRHKPHTYKLNFKISLPGPDSKQMEGLKEMDLETKILDQKLIQPAKASEDLLMEIFSKVYDDAEVINMQIIYMPYYDILIKSATHDKKFKLPAFL